MWREYTRTCNRQYTTHSTQWLHLKVYLKDCQCIHDPSMCATCAHVLCVHMHVCECVRVYVCVCSKSNI